MYANYLVAKMYLITQKKGGHPKAPPQALTQTLLL